MTAGTDAFKGLALPVNGEATMTQQTAATDILTIIGASGQTGDYLNLVDSSGNEDFSFQANAILKMGNVTAKPASGALGGMFMHRTGTSYRLGLFVTGSTAKYAKFSLTIGG